MDAVKNILKNPIIRQGLKVASPEIALGVDLVMTVVSSLFSRRRKKPSVKKLLNTIDQRLAKILEDLATTTSKGMRAECEIRAHELLGILNEWDKIS